MKKVIICQNCQSENKLTAYSCTNCHKSLAGIEPTSIIDPVIKNDTSSWLEETQEEEQKSTTTTSTKEIFTPKLEIILNSGIKFEIDSGILLGRSSASIKFLEEVRNKLYISRKHAWLGLINDKYYLIDLASKHGTFLNNKRIEPNKHEQIITNRLAEVCLGESYSFQIQCSTEEV